MRGMLRYYYRITPDGKPIPGSLRSSRRALKGPYFVEVTNSCCGVSSSNAAPVASSLSISGTTVVGSTLTSHYTYTDAESDLEGTSVFRWYRADDSSGTNRVTISGATSSTYVLQAGDDSKYIQFSVTPKALTGTVTGVMKRSPYTDIITTADITAPTVSSMTATDSTHITVVFSESVTGTTGMTFNNGSLQTPSAVSGAGSNTYIFTVPGPLAFGQTITATYAPGTITDVPGNPLGAFSTQPVTNALPDLVEWVSVNSDPFSALSGGSDTLTYTGSTAWITSPQIDAHTHTSGQYLVVRYNSTHPDYGFWDESGTLNVNVAIPGVQFPHTIFVQGGKKYIVSGSVDFSTNPSARVTFHN